MRLITGLLSVPIQGTIVSTFPGYYSQSPCHLLMVTPTDNTHLYSVNDTSDFATTRTVNWQQNTGNTCFWTTLRVDHKVLKEICTFFWLISPDFLNRFLVDIRPFLGPLMPPFWTSSDFFSWFQSQNGQPYSHLAETLCVTDSLRFASGATTADLLTASMAAEPISSTYLWAGIGRAQNQDLLCHRQTLYQLSYLLLHLFLADLSDFIVLLCSVNSLRSQGTELFVLVVVPPSRADLICHASITVRLYAWAPPTNSSPMPWLLVPLPGQYLWAIRFSLRVH